jgi:hypothetical protein
MPRRARLPRHARDRAAALVDAASQRLIGEAGRHKKTLVLAGSALALAGAASAAAVPTGTGSRAAAAQHAYLTADLRTKPTGQAAQPQVPVALMAVRDVIHWPAKPAAAPAPAPPPLADQLLPVGTDGPQSWMPISGSQLANATTIVQQAEAKQMGLRSAVIAVATAMQESRLQNLDYGSGDSLGLFQQQPWTGWGTAQQIMNPAFAADAFLTALQQYQATDPGWAAQPLWESAQSVQKSGYPLAYAQWEAQAASLVQQITGSPQQ